MRENRTLTRYRISILATLQDVIAVEWRITNRRMLGILDIEDPDENAFVNVAKVIFQDSGMTNFLERELGASIDHDGCAVVYEIAYFRPLIEFNPTNIPERD